MPQRGRNRMQSASEARPIKERAAAAQRRDRII
jgi:hypothetical protein